MPNDNDFNLEDWWEEEGELGELEAFGDDPIGGTSAGDPPEPQAWGDVGSVGFTSIIPENEMEDVLAATLQKIQTTKIADEWFYVARRCQILNIHEYITASEDLIYESKISTKMKNGYVSLPCAEIYFHIMRERWK